MSEASPSLPHAADAQRSPRRWRRWIAGFLVVVVVTLSAVAGYLVLTPVGIAAPDGTAMRSMTWDEANAAVAEIQAKEASDPSIRPDCHTRLYDHGAPTAGVVVLLHGYTNCPKQDDALAALLVDRGYTVYVPRAPHHGQDPDRRDPLASLSADQLAAYGDESMNIAAGLGDEVSVLGLSGGGLVASYIAQYRSDAALVVPVAAFLGLPSVPDPLLPAVVNGIELLPPIDMREPSPDEAIRGPYPHGASDTSAQAAAAYMAVAQTILRSAEHEPPKAGRIITVINDADTTVSNEMIGNLAARWEGTAPDRTGVRRLDAALSLLHDLITPDRAGQKVDVVYPILLDLLTGP